MEQIKWVKNECPKTDCSKELSLMAPEAIRKVRRFHESFPDYEPTPLVKLPALAEKLGVKSIYVKDESYRFGLNAFKVLGGSYAMAGYVAGLIGCNVSELTYKKFTSAELRKKIGEVTFFTATDGNHGRGIAWAASRLGQKSVVYMPAGSSQSRLENIRREGATASIIDGNYDDAVRLAAAEAKKTKNGVFVQDTAWEGYEVIPSLIMQGYGTMALEADEQMKEYGDNYPTHVFLQAGVGSFAGAVQGFYSNAYPETCPITAVMEPFAADCLYRSALAREYRTVGGEMNTIMAGLACGEPNTISWNILSNETNYFVSLPDQTAAIGMRVLSAPLRGDKRVISGESGAVGAGLLLTLMTAGDDEAAKLRKQMALGADSVVMLYSSEGDTDPDKYLEIVWSGEL